MGPHNYTRNTVQSLVTSLPNITAQCFSTCATRTDAPSEDLQMGEPLTHRQPEEEFDGPRGLCQATAHKLTDDALLHIFDFYMNDNNPPYTLRSEHLDEWHTLVHVCRRWRDLVFASPRHLDLRLLCRRDTPVREMLDIWPALPIGIHDHWTGLRDVGPDNIVAALEHSDRVCSIDLTGVPSSIWETLTAAMQVPFPELTALRLWSDKTSTSVLSDSFVGGSAPRLHTLWLSGIIFPALPNLLLSTSDLVNLALVDVPHSGYISPEAMVACLSSLNRLEDLRLGFELPQSRPDRPSPPPQTRVVLPVLTELMFQGMADYSEDFLTRIDTPVLNNFSMTFFLGLIFDVPHLKHFIGRAKRFRPPKAASVLFCFRSIQLALDPYQPHRSMLEVRWDRIDWRVDSMALMCGQLSPFFSLIERLDFILCRPPSKPQEEDDIKSTQFLELFRPFTAVRSLHVSRSLVPLIATALQVLIVGPRATEVLPNLRDIFLGGSAMSDVSEAMRPFVAARRLSGQPVAVHHWEGLTVDWW